MSNSSSKKRRTEKDYSLLTQAEQCLRNPDMFVGSTNVQRGNDQEGHGWSYYFDGVHVPKYVIPALYKLVDELLVNVTDVYQKNKGNQKEDPVKNVWITCDWKESTITVRNDGSGVPIEKHIKASKQLKRDILCPELVWFEFGSGDNFEGDRQVGGKNGYGAKLCGVFSERYTVQTCNGNGLAFRKIARENMSIMEDAETRPSNNRAYTSISFKIDLKRFSVNGKKIKTVPRDTRFAIEQRIQDVANFMPDVKVFYGPDKTRIMPKSLKVQAKEALGKVLFTYEKENYFVSVGVRKEEEGSGCISYVNGTFNRFGGRHIQGVLSQLNWGMQKFDPSNYGKANIARHTLARKLLVFASLKKVVNVMYDGQCKDEVKSAVNLKCGISYNEKEHKKYFKALKKVLKDYIAKKRANSENREAKRSDGEGNNRYVNVEDLVDARHAGGVWSKNCCLYVVEGKSAGRLTCEMVPNDKNGVLPIRGKMKNAGKCSKAEFNKNKEVCAIKQALGLKQSTKTPENLRYGKLVIMTDQDSDGYHIRMLLLSMFAMYWPDLLKKGFVWIFETPIVKAKKGARTLNFYDQSKVEEHVESNTGWTYKYYKGLGTSTAADAREYYRNKSDLMWKVSGDLNLIKKCMTNTAEAQTYRKWIASGEKPCERLDRGNVEFIVKRQFGNFAFAQNLRKIPHMVDGLLPSMRKVLSYALQYFKDGDNDNIVDRFANRAADKMKYHHGSSNLVGVIVNMASDYVGGTPLPYFFKGGQFASRHDNAHAAGRYLKTGLLPYVKMLFPPIDMEFYEQQKDEGDVIEPKYLVPIIPTLLVNGHRGGMGVGWASEIPPRKFLDVIRMVKNKLNTPTVAYNAPIHYANFTGTVHEKTTEGVWNVDMDNGNITITELPVGFKTDKFVEHVRKHHPRIEFLDGHAIGDKIHLKIIGGCDTGVMEKLMKRPIKQNWVTFNLDGNIESIDDPNDAPGKILDVFMKERSIIYEKRRAKIAANLQKEWEKLTVKAMVIKSYLDGVWCAKDLENPFEWSGVCLKINGMSNAEVVVRENDLDVSIRKLNGTQYTNLQSKAMLCKSHMEEVLNTPIKSTWLKELNALEKEVCGDTMAVETPNVGEKRVVMDLTSD